MWIKLPPVIDIDTYTLDSDSRFSRHVRHDLIDQREGIAVR